MSVAHEMDAIYGITDFTMTSSQLQRSAVLVRANTTLAFHEFDKAQSALPPNQRLRRQYSTDSKPRSTSTASKTSSSTLYEDVVVDQDFNSIMERIRQCVETIQGIRVELEETLPTTTRAASV
ncbi:hypothetical protein LEN26_014524 [Aphanomyces euteiches]|nr:hypothetical protein LEN26_014524 [Aphanomyces euteiches]KAH9111225.1 hypothetical protein AeMF1_014201 [Aphanomyces euteiches]KAH9186369.1 hypothetical protein AeNC1_011655 [Aphanomyces euteiches]